MSNREIPHPLLKAKSAKLTQRASNKMLALEQILLEIFRHSLPTTDKYFKIMQLI